jgi:type II secretory pathway pseudopilin PulG
MVVRVSAFQTERAQELSRAMNQIAAAIRQARTDSSSSPQDIKNLLDAYCATEAELRSLIAPLVKPLS